MSLIGALLAGLFLSITAVPLFPLIFIQGFKEAYHEGLGYLALYIISNVSFSILPFLFIFLAFSNSLMDGMVFTISMYGVVIYAALERK